ncbi:MAG: hypothetical protein Q4C50_08380 [Eubacteriales bacterium]|nr:hypothetical protein [Eubacteriales bacterium]
MSSRKKQISYAALKSIPTICPRCNAQIKIDAVNKTGVCEYCGTHFILEGDKVTIHDAEEKTQTKKSGKSKSPLFLFGLLAVLSLGMLYFNHSGSDTESPLGPANNDVLVAKTASEYALADAVSAPGAVIGEPIADLEITKAGYSVVNGYLYYALAIHNNSDTNAVVLPGYRYTAKSADGTILGAGEHYLFSIYPGQDCVWGFLGFEISAMPETVEFSLIPPAESNIMPSSMMTQPEFKPYEIKNISEKKDSILGNTIMGEVYNPNDYMVDQIAVSVVFLDAEGVLQGGETTFVDRVAAKSSAPFSLYTIYPQAENYQVFASSWSL